MRVIVFGHHIHGHVSGLGWVKYNIIKALKDAEHEPISVFNSKMDVAFQEGICSEERTDKELKIPYMGVTGALSWENAVETIEPDMVICVGNPEHSWFVPLAKSLKNIKKIYWYISEAKTINRYVPSRDEKYLDLKKVMSYYDKIIPATEITKQALVYDMEMSNLEDAEIITPPVWKWNTSKQKEYDYRENARIPLDSKIFFCITNNNERKRLDQLMIYFKEKLLTKPCKRLVIHTSLDIEGGYDLVAIAARLGIGGNVVINTENTVEAMEGIFSAGNTFVNMPAAEGYGLPYHEALLLGTKCIHSGIGHILEEAPLLKGCNIELVEAKHPYFYKIGNQVWYSIGTGAMIKKYGRKGKYTIEEIINTPEQFAKKILNSIGATPLKNEIDVK